MESITTKSPIMLYTEQTPNPESLKFVTNKMLYKGTADFKEESLAKQWSPLAAELFALPYVKGVYICNNFVTIKKEFNYSWEDIMLSLKDFIKNFLNDEKTVITEGFEQAMAQLENEKVEISYSSDEAELVNKIKDLIDTYVKPAVEMDGATSNSKVSMMASWK